MALVKLTAVVLLLTLSTVASYRLPTVYSPSYYDIHLVLPSEIFTVENATSYTGTVEITFTSSQNVSEIVLHASENYVNITSVTVTSPNATNNVTGWLVNATTDILTISLENALVIDGENLLRLSFDGRLSTTDMYGFYKSSYTDSTNTTSYLATTQMEATYARRAFPCFDEPSYKANFSISLTYPEGLNALGNMDILNTTIDNGTITTTFSTTPVMSSYLVAFIVSKFTCTNGSAIEETLPYQVCSRNETSSIRGLALDVAPLVVNSLNSYLNFNYSLSMNKLDQVAIPDFSAGAMENWGLITYRERALLYDDNETSNSIQQYIAAVIAHELTHQWFGNLVTCRWWSEIFLNEGFATFFEHYTTHEIYPNLEMDKQFIIKTLQYVFEEDTSSTEALRTSASSPEEVSGRFGGITYDKGASVLRMVEHILGTDVWKTGLSNYLNQFAYSSAEPADLWGVLGLNATGLPGVNLTVVMANWTNAPGYPVVNVSLNGTELTLTQQRFVLSNTTDTNTTWYIPITYATSENTSDFQKTTPVAWLPPSAGLTLNVSANLTWIVVNNLQTGYYRVNYDSALWQALAAALRQPDYSGIPEINRAQTVNDAFNLARGGYITYSQLFSITEFLTNETSYTVWYPALGGFEYLLKRIGDNSTLGLAISNHVVNLTSTLIAAVPITSTNSSNHIYTLNQVLAQSWACRFGDANCTAEAVRLFEEYKNTSVRPNKNLRSIVYCYGLKNSNNISSDWDFLWNAFLSTSLSTEQVTILSALGCPSNATILNSYLEKTLFDESGIRSQDYVSVFSAVYTGSITGVDTALDFFINNYNAIISRYTSMNSVGKILKGIAEQITTNAQILKLQNLISSNVLNGTLLESANSALSSVQNNYKWVNTYRSSLNEYYGIQEATTPSGTTNSTASPTTVSTSSSSITPTSTTPSTTTESSAYQSCISLGLMIIGVFVIMM